ncbi:MAG: hypothetical protein WC073_15590 [Sterolibacterium sp.]
MKLKNILFVGACLISASQVSTASNEVTIFSQPNCGEWLELTSNGKKKWLLGFLSGMNYGYSINHKGHDPLRQVKSYTQLFEWMDSYCKTNPERDIADGGAALFKELKNK